ncbi:MAG: hypothetical protein L6W00_11215 [Lentisphaeria bacterium]|nr:MAG: hypothetical protein L6W00_11215 [Lentisphaeria bacterium]
MRYLLLCLAFSALVPATFAAEEQTTPISEFMKLARNPYPVSSYAALEGKVRHLRRGGRPETVPIYFGIILQPERMTGQIILDGREGYMLGQTRRSGSSETTVVPMKSNTGDAGSENRLGHMGIRPSDLTMSFLYYPVVRELESESVRTVPCRVVLLESPDKKEQVKVYIARDYHFPLKAEFFEERPRGGLHSALWRSTASARATASTTPTVSAFSAPAGEPASNSTSPPPSANSTRPDRRR